MIFVSSFLAAFVVFALSDLARARETMREIEKEVDTLFPQSRERVEWIASLVEGRRQPEPQHDLASEVNGQVGEMARAVIRIRNAELIDAFGWLRLIFEFVVPAGLGAAAIIALAVRLS